MEALAILAAIGAANALARRKLPLLRFPYDPLMLPWLPCSACAVPVLLRNARISRTLNQHVLEGGTLSDDGALEVVVVSHGNRHRDIPGFSSPHLVDLETYDGHAFTVKSLHDLFRQIHWRECLPEDLGV
eukprot:CAMPEP_0181501278 /NCGR_PEP_ID=MMETSP1110-20121109/55706_1 /TAXON_ID=174948 /ORGANISM="Symbiodinium sp., Strain CCMP421" /LENGTH=129 /DNA_ID=CAMNT_0023629719 /DNA_START=107 /DNA_END=496 /DNA_ORIENTATION=+